MLLFNKRDGAFAEGNFYTKKLNYNFVLGCAVKKQNKIKTKKKPLPKLSIKYVTHISRITKW